MKLVYLTLICYGAFFSQTLNLNAACIKNLAGNTFFVYDAKGNNIAEVTSTHHAIISNNSYPITISWCSNGPNTNTPNDCNSSTAWGSWYNITITTQKCYIINSANGVIWKTRLACDLCS